MQSKTYATSALNAPSVPPAIRNITTADGAILRIYIHGPATAPPIVLAHGWCEQAAYWNPQINALAGDFRVITYDHRGHGASSMGSRRPSAEILADDFADVVGETLRPGERAVLAGHSLGGMTIMSWSRHHPTQAAAHAGAVLLANTADGALIEHTRMIPFLRPGLLPRPVAASLIAGTLPMPPVWLLRPIVKWRIMPGGSRDAVDFCTRIFKSCPGQVRGRWGRMLAQMELGGPHPISGTPTTVIVGERDYLTPPVHSERIVEALRAAGNLDEYVVLPGIGHESNVEAPDTFNTHLRRLCGLVQRRTEEVA